MRTHTSHTNISDKKFMCCISCPITLHCTFYELYYSNPIYSCIILILYICCRTNAVPCCLLLFGVWKNNYCIVFLRQANPFKRTTLRDTVYFGWNYRLWIGLEVSNTSKSSVWSFWISHANFFLINDVKPRLGKFCCFCAIYTYINV